MTDGGILYDPTPGPDDELRRRRERADGLWTGPARNSEEPQTAAAEVARLLQQAREKMERKDFQPAIARLDRALRLDARHAEAYLLTAECLLALDQPERALDQLVDAERYAGKELRPRIKDTRRRCVGTARAEHLEQARELLRGGDPRRAAAVLRRCEELLGSDEQLRLIQTYAAVRLDQSGTGTDRTDAPWLDAVELERVLRWLTKEELSAAEEALREQRFEAALRAGRDATRIDNRGAYCALLSASALFHLVQQSVSGSAPSDLELMRTRLAKAASFARYAERDRSLDSQRRPLAAAIDAVLRDVDRHLAQVKEAEPVRAVVDRFNRLMRHYDKPVLTLFEASNLRSSLAPIDAEVNRLRRRYPADSPAGRTLAELARAVSRVMAQLRW